ncbi:MAG: asparaginase [Oscillospiraceae bacterium]|nr:asparaginase [Oscillospiraceae bacterium]
MKKILLLTTGGTISSRLTSEGLAPANDASILSGSIDTLRRSYDITVKSILNMDSSNIQPEEWQLIARSIYAGCGEFDGIVVGHGTDTMAYTASIMTYMLLNLNVPVVFTGAQLPIEHPLTDGLDNLRTAFAMAASGRPGVFLAFNREVILGCRAVKTHTTNFGAFDSVNYPLIGTVSGSGLAINDAAIPAANGEFRLRDKLCKQVFLLKLTPGLDPKIFDMLMNMNYRGLVIEAFGAGGLHFVRRNLIEKLSAARERGIAVVVNSQCLYESSNFDLYQTGKKVLEQGAIQSYDMTTEAVVTKLMWALGQTDSVDGVRELFASALAGEMGAAPA